MRTNRTKQISPRRIASDIYRRAGCPVAEPVAPSQLAEAAGVTVRPMVCVVSCDGMSYPGREGWRIEVHPGMHRGKRERTIAELLAGIALDRRGLDTDANTVAVGDELIRRWRSAP